MVMLRNKEIGDENERDANQRKLEELLSNKKAVQQQIDDANLLREQARQEYLKEKAQVDAVVQRMIQEDNEH